jgi:hypothetical protein
MQIPLQLQVNLAQMKCIGDFSAIFDCVTMLKVIL